MGFDENQARHAFESCNGNLEQAVDYLLDGGDAAAAAGGGGNVTSGSETTTTTAPKMIVADNISQYSVEKGKSACTCIALTMAASFLQQVIEEDNKNKDAATRILTCDFLRHNIMEGVDIYRQLVSCNTQMVEVEHMSAEEILEQQEDMGNDALPKFASLELVGGYVRQGVLSTPGMDLQSMMQGCITEYYQQNQHQQSQQWMAILITKTPETIVVCVPPPASEERHYCLLDSHPRPHLFVESSTNAYGRIYTTLDGLVQSLHTIFPSTVLGPDIPETMAMMYNSFDLYPLVLKKKT